MLATMPIRVEGFIGTPLKGGSAESARS